MNFTRFSNFYFFLSGLLIGGSIAVLIIFGLKFGIEFTGGSILEVEYQEQRSSLQEVREQLEGAGFPAVQMQEAGEKGLILRSRDLSEEDHQKILGGLGPNVKELRFESAGPTIGKELKEKTLVITLLSLLIIVVYIALAFRRVTGPVKAWHWGVASLLALLHDTIIPLGLFAILGKLQGMEFTIPVVVAILTVVGYSINNNIVVFDRIRENLLKRKGFDFENTVNVSIKETLTRNMNTSLTVLITLVSILFLGGSTLQGFSIALIAGILVGLYSSIFFCPAFLVKAFSRPKP